MTTPIILQITGLFAAILIAIFRNQLAQIGDKLVSRKKAMWAWFLMFLKITVFYLSPIFWITYSYLYMDFDKLFVLSVSVNSSLLFCSFLMDMHSGLYRMFLWLYKGIDLSLEQIDNTRDTFIELISQSNKSHERVNQRIIDLIKELSIEIEKVKRRKPEK